MTPEQIKIITNIYVWHFILFLFSSGLVVFIIGQILESLKDKSMRKKVIMTLLHECNRNENELINSINASAEKEKQFPGRNLPVVNTFSIGYLNVFNEKFLFSFTFHNDVMFAYFDDLKNRVYIQGGNPVTTSNDLLKRKDVFDEYKSFLLLACKHAYDFNFPIALLDNKYMKVQP